MAQACECQASTEPDLKVLGICWHSKLSLWDLALVATSDSFPTLISVKLPPRTTTDLSWRPLDIPGTAHVPASAHEAPLVWEHLSLPLTCQRLLVLLDSGDWKEQSYFLREKKACQDGV